MTGAAARAAIGRGRGRGEGGRGRRLIRAGTLGLAALVVSAALLGCAMSPAEREATTRAWAERDAERARECTRGRYVAGSCIGGGGP